MSPKSHRQARQIIERMLAYPPSREKSLGTATEHLPTAGHNDRHLIFAVAVDPHARIPPIDRNLVQEVFNIFAAVVIVTAAPLPTARPVADKIYPDAWDVRDQSRSFFKRRRKGDPVVTGADGYGPAKATGKRDVYISVVSAQLHVEECTTTFVGGERVVLFMSHPLKNNGRH